MKMRFWKTVARILRGVKRVGVALERFNAEPGGGEVRGVKKGTVGLRVIDGEAIFEGFWREQEGSVLC